MRLLDLHDHRQVSAHDCGPTAFRIVCDYFGKAPPAPVSCTIMGLGPDYLESHLRMAGFAVQFGSMTIADLRHHQEQDRPVICLVNYDGEGHYIVSRGVSRGRVYFICPTKGSLWLPVLDFQMIWTDVHRLGPTLQQFGIAVGSG